MKNAWFLLFHKYTMSRGYDPAGIESLKADFPTAKKLGVELIIFESYPADFAYGDYLVPWCGENLRAAADAAHEAGFKVIPYTNATEVDVKSSVYREHRDWLAKPPLGREYSAFISCFLPEYFKEGDFFNKLVCPAGPWRGYYLDQCSGLMEQYGFDGIYVDRVDYRVPCRAHQGFSRALPEMIGELKERIKSAGGENLLVINDSFIRPDRIFKQVMGHTDFILTEILPPGTVQEINNWVTFATSPALHAVKQFTEWAMRTMYGGWAKSPAPDAGRIERRVNMLRRETGKDILVFTHALSPAGARAAFAAAGNTGQGACIFSPKPLRDSENILALIE